MERPTIYIFTDGASSGNPGPGGYGVILRCGTYEKEFSDGFARTTNNRMELLAVIVGLEAIKWKRAHVEIVTDSKYVCESVNRNWLFSWLSKNFEERINRDLWKRFLAVYRKHDVEIHWVHGHDGHPENERCDAMAVAAYKANPTKIDEGYIEKPKKKEKEMKLCL